MQNCIIQCVDFEGKKLKRIEGNGTTERTAIDALKTLLRKSGETFSMLKLRTVFSYGLNDHMMNLRKSILMSLLTKSGPCCLVKPLTKAVTSALKNIAYTN